MASATRIFISYARQDLAHLRALDAQLANLKRQERIEVWTDQVLEPGERWEATLLKALRETDILLCLVTPDFMASNFIHDVELKESLLREQRGQVRIVPVLVRPTEFKGHALDAHQGLPRGFKPVTEWRNRDRAWMEVVEGLCMALAKPLTSLDVPQPLPPGYEPLFEGHPPSALLVARYQVVPFFLALRASELERIHTWLEHERRFDVLLMIGDAGTGKTRMLYEVIKRRREACWVAGLVDARSSFAEQQESLKEALAVPHPLLVALDYAETSPELGRLLEWLQVQSHRREKPVRMLLAARGAGDWWQNLPLTLKQPLSSLLKSPPLSVGANPEASTPEALAELYRESLQRFAGALREPLPEPLPFDSLDRRPLFVLLTALAQTLALPTKRETLLEALIHHERQFWRSLLPEHAYDQDPVLADTHRLVAAVALRGGVRSEPELKSLIERLAPVPELTLTRALSFMRRVYPGAGLLWARPVEPDLLGAELVRQVLIKPGTDLLLKPALADNAPEALATAFRLLEDIGQEDEALSRHSLEALLIHHIEARAQPALQAATRWKGDRPVHLIADVLLARLKREASTELLVKIHNVLPQQSLALAELALWVTSEYLRRAPYLQDAVKASILINLGNWFSDLGRWEEALQATREAVTLYRRIEEQEPGAVIHALGKNLNNVGKILSRLGQRDEALQAIEEAVVICRGLMKWRPDIFTPDYGMSLGNLSNALSDLGRREEALSAAQETLEIYRWLAKGNQAAFIPDLARSLTNLATKMSALGQRENALQAAQEAASLFRGLADQHPDAFISELAMSIINLGAMLSNLGQRDEALQTASEAVSLYKQLAELHPDAYTYEMTKGLNNLGNMLGDLGRLEEAHQASQAAVTHYRRLAEQHPAAFNPDLALSLNNLGKVLNDLGRRAEALSTTQEAVSLYRRQAKQHMEALSPDLARTLNNLSAMYNALGRRREALEAVREAVSLYRHLAEQHPAAFEPDLAGSLNNLGAMHTELGQREEALLAIEEVVRLYRSRVEQLPYVFTPDLARSLKNQGAMLRALKRLDGALQTASEAVALYQRLTELHPGVFTPDLASSLSNLGVMLSDLGRRDEALQATLKAVTHYRRLAAQRPDSFTSDLAGSLNNLGKQLGDCARHEEALRALQEAVTLYRRLAEQHPDRFVHDLARILNNLVKALSDNDCLDAALLAAEEGVSLQRRLAEQLPEVFISALAESLKNLGTLLGSMERKKEALKATQEAVTIYRRLARQNPDLYVSDFITCLGHLADDLAALGKRRKALAAAREAVDLLTPYYLKLPDDYRQQWLNHARILRARLREAGIAYTSDPQLIKYMDGLAQLERRIGSS